MAGTSFWPKFAAGNIAAWSVLALVTLAGTEAYLRLTIPASSSESIYEYTLASKRYKVMKPNARLIAWGKELRTNNLGFRDDARVVPPKQPGEFRIIVLGDSFTVSAGVDYAQIYTSLVQRKLREKHANVRVINLAVGGYNIVQWALVLQEVGLALEPDLVLVSMFPEHDFGNETYLRNYRVASGQESALQPLPWYESLYVYRAFLGKAHARIERFFAKETKQERQVGDAWGDNIRALHTIVELSRGKKLPALVTMLPPTLNYERQRALFDRVGAHCKQHGLTCLDLRERFAAAKIPESTLRLNALDAHPNEAYNAYVAAYLAEYLAPYLAGRRRAATGL